MTRQTTIVVIGSLRVNDIQHYYRAVLFVPHAELPDRQSDTHVHTHTHTHTTHTHTLKLKYLSYCYHFWLSHRCLLKTELTVCLNVVNYQIFYIFSTLYSGNVSGLQFALDKRDCQILFFLFLCENMLWVLMRNTAVRHF